MAESNTVFSTLLASSPKGVRRGTDLETVLGQWTSNDRVVVTIPDCTRPIDCVPVLQSLESRLGSISGVVVGLGLHRRLSKEEWQLFKEVSHMDIMNHDPDDCIGIDQRDGVSIGVSKRIMNADWSITVGTIEIHQYAGFSGGYKGVVVGCGSRNSISRLHSRHFVCSETVKVGVVKDNVFRSEIERIGALTNCQLALGFVPSLGEWWFGRPSALNSLAQEVLRPWESVERMYGGAILKVPESKGQTFYQASRAATYLALSPNPPIKNGGSLILSAKLTEGLGSEDGFRNALHTYESPWKETLDEDLKGAGAQRIWMLARLMQRFKLVLHGVENPTLFKSLGIQVVEELPREYLVVEDCFSQIPQLSS